MECVPLPFSKLSAAGSLLSRYGQLCAPISKRKYRASRTVNVFLAAISCNLPASTLLENAARPDCFLDIHNLQQLVLQVSNAVDLFIPLLTRWMLVHYDGDSGSCPFVAAGHDLKF